MRRFKTAPLCLALAAALIFCGCEGESGPSEVVVSQSSSESSENAAFPVEVCGVTLEKPVSKAVSLSPAATELICELGFRDRLLGVSDYCDHPEDLSLPRFGSTENPDIEGIIKQSPDAVFASSLLSERDIYMLNSAGISVITTEAPVNIEDYAALYEQTALAFYGKELLDEQKGETKAAAAGKTARKALETAAKEADFKKFIYITEKFTAAGADTFESAVLSLAGENLCEEKGYPAAEACAELSPDIIIVSNALDYETVCENETLAEFIYEGAQVLFADPSLFERPTKRTAEIFKIG